MFEWVRHLVDGGVVVGRRRWRQVYIVVNGCVHFRLDHARRVFAVHHLITRTRAVPAVSAAAVASNVVFVVAQQLCQSVPRRLRRRYVRLRDVVFIPILVLCIYMMIMCRNSLREAVHNTRRHGPSMPVSFWTPVWISHVHEFRQWHIYRGGGRGDVCPPDFRPRGQSCKSSPTF